MAKAKSSFQVELMKEREKNANLEENLEHARQKLLEQEAKLVRKLKTVEEKLDEERGARGVAEEQLKKLHKATEHSVDSLKKKYQGDLRQAQQQFNLLSETRNELQRQLTGLRKQTDHHSRRMEREIRTLKAELTTAGDTLKQRQEQLDRMRLVAIELERAKGRCAGMLTSQRMLREHAAQLEQALGASEAALAEMTANFECSEKGLELQQKKAGERIAALEATLKSCEDLVQELRGRLRNEKKEKVALMEDLQTITQELQEKQERLRTATTKADSLAQELERAVNKTKQFSDQLQTVRGKLETSELARGKLQTHVDLLCDAEKAQEKHVAAVQWEAGQSQREADYLKEQLRLGEERQQRELGNLRGALQVARGEVTSLRSEVSDVRKTRCDKQHEVVQLRDALLGAKRDTQCVRQQLFARTQQLEAIRRAVTMATDLDQLRDLLPRGELDKVGDTGDESFGSVVTAGSSERYRRVRLSKFERLPEKGPRGARGNPFTLKLKMYILPTQVR